MEHNAIGFDRVGVDRGRSPRLCSACPPCRPLPRYRHRRYRPHLLRRPFRRLRHYPPRRRFHRPRPRRHPPCPLPRRPRRRFSPSRRAPLRHSGARSRDSIRTSHRAPTQPLGSPRTAARDADGRRKRSGSLTPKSTTPACTGDEARDSPGRAEPADVVLSGPRMPRRKIRGWIYRPHPRPLRPAPRSSSSRSPSMKAGIAPRPY